MNHILYDLLVTGFLLSLIAAINPASILRISIGKKGAKIERHIPGKDERKTIEEAVKDEVSPKAAESVKEVIENAKRRDEVKRSPEDYLLLATEAWRAKDYDSALTNVFEGLRLFPDNKRTEATLVYRLGIIWDDMKLPEKAIQKYHEAIEIDSHFSWPYNGLGLTYDKLNRDEEAEQAYKKSLQLDPDFAHAHVNLGNLYSKLNRDEEAEQAYKKAVQLDPDLATTHSNMGVLYEKLDRDEEAEQAYKRALQLDPDYADAHNNLGLLYKKLDRDEEAEREFKEAERLKK